MITNHSVYEQLKLGLSSFVANQREMYPFYGQAIHKTSLLPRQLWLKGPFGWLDFLGSQGGWGDMGHGQQAVGLAGLTFLG